MSQGWNTLFDRYYRKLEIYNYGGGAADWKDDFSFEKYMIAAAQFGGPIAMIRDERKTLLMGGEEDYGGQNKMRIYTSAGKLISSFHWIFKGLVKIGWTNQEDLACVLDDGTVYLFNVHGERVGNFNMGQAAKDDSVAEAVIWPTGVVVRTSVKSELYAVTSFYRPMVITLADPRLAGLTSPPTSMAVVPPDVHPQGILEVFLATAKGSIIVVDPKEAEDQKLTLGPFNRMVVCPTGGVIACFNDQGTLHVMSTDFTKNLSKFVTESKLPPKDLGWCGEDSVVLYWDEVLLIVGPYSDFIKYPYDTSLHLVTECDGVRVLSAKRCEFLQRVPDSTQTIFKAHSTTPAAQLYDATESFQKKDVKADESIRGIKEKRQLDAAIEQCLNAAGHEFESKIQTQLLKAASYGKLFSDTFQSDLFVDTCRTLRVLNAVRSTLVGIPLTLDQYNKLEADVLIDRLINRHEHLLALRICKYLRMQPEKVLIHWACAKTKAAEGDNDEKLGRLIVEKLSASPGISFAQIAQTAFKAGKKQLATMLLEYEPRAVDQVPLLISMKEDELALDKSIESGDTDLVYYALLHIKKTRSFKEFFPLIKDRPLARNLYVSYCKEQDLDALKEFYFHMQMPHEAAHVMVFQAYKSESWKERLYTLDVALGFYQKDKARDPLPAIATEEQLTLLKMERKFEEEAKGGDPMKPLDPYIDLSMSKVMAKQISQGKKPSKIKEKFKIPDKRAWHIEVKTLAKHKLWTELGQLVANKKVPPIGFEPFVEACVEEKAYEQAVRYINRMTDPQEQMEWLCNIGFWKEAAAIAAKEKDVDALSFIRARCRDRNIQGHIDALIRMTKQGEK